MHEISLFILVGLSFSVVFLIKGLSTLKYKNPGATIPPLLIFILSVELLYGWLYSSRTILLFPHTLRLNTPLVFLLGPAVYFLIKSLLEPEMKWKKNHFWHALPFMLVLIYFIPLYFSTSAMKLDYLTSMYISLPEDSIILGAFRRIQQGVYLAAMMVLLLKDRDNLKLTRSKHIVYSIILIFTALWGISIFRYLFNFQLLTGILDSMVLSMLAIYIVYQKISVFKVKNRQSLDPNQFQNYVDQIKNALYYNDEILNPKYSLQDLSQKINLPIAKVSKIINQGMDTNFNNLINKYRVDKAIELLSNEENNYLTIEAISRQAGFNSTSSFNYNFKKITGKTPKVFRSF